MEVHKKSNADNANEVLFILLGVLFTTMNIEYAKGQVILSRS